MTSRHDWSIINQIMETGNSSLNIYTIERFIIKAVFQEECV